MAYAGAVRAFCSDATDLLVSRDPAERRASRMLGHRSTQWIVPRGRADEERLTEDIIELADQYGRCGCRMVTGLLNNAGWCEAHIRTGWFDRKPSLAH